jgi:hypothetical protein
MRGEKQHARSLTGENAGRIGRRQSGRQHHLLWTALCRGVRRSRSHRAASGEGLGASIIAQGELASVTAEALARWQASGISASDQAKLAAVSFSMSDLEPGHLGDASGSTVLIHRDAAGWGWYVDPTPAADAEFAACSGDLRAGEGTRLKAAWTC